MKTLFVCSKKDLQLNDNIDKYIIPETCYVYFGEKDERYVVVDKTYDEKEYALMHKKVYQKRKEVIAWITKAFNQEFSLDFMEEQWDFLLGSFLSQIIFSLMDKFEKVSDYEGMKFEFCRHEMETPKRMWDFSIQSDEVQACIYSIICKSYGFEERKDINANHEEKPVAPEQHRIKRSLKIFDFSKWKRYVWRMKHILFDYLIIHCSLYKVFKTQKRCVSLLVRTFLDEQILNEIENKSDGKIVQLNTEYYNMFYKQSPHNVDKEMRRRLFKDFLVNDRFDGVLKICLMKFIPTEYMEGIRENYKEACKVASIYFPQKIYTAAYLLGYTIVHSLFAAIKKGEGVELVDIQHSDAYISNKAAAIYEIQSFDKFITSGWNESSEYGKVKPLMEARHWRRIAPKNNCKDIKKILLISTDDYQYEKGWAKTLNFCERHLDFVNHLSANLRSKLIVRLRDDVKNLAQEYYEKFPEVVVHKIDKCSMDEDLMNADLVICDHRSSPYFESLLYNKPTLLYDGMVVKMYNQEFEKYIEKLGQLGFYRREGSELASYVNENIDEIGNVWNSDKSQNLIRQMLNDVIGIDQDPIKVWYEELIG